MANLHAIGDNRDKVTLANFYDENRPLEIQLKQGLSPQKNAEVYYTKAKKQQVEVNMLQQALVKKEQEISMLHDQIQQVQSISRPKEVARIYFFRRNTGEDPKGRATALPSIRI